MKTKITFLFAFVFVLTTNAQKWTSYTTTNGLVNDRVTSITIDSQGNKWFGTNGGVSKFDGANWITYTTTEGLACNTISSIAIDIKGNKWFGNWDCEGGVTKFDGTNWITYKKSDGLVSNNILSIATDEQGNVWFGTNQGVSKFDGTNWTSYTTTNGLINNWVTSITIDSQGNKWFGTSGGVSKFEEVVSITNSPKAENKINISLSTFPNPSSNETVLLFPNYDKYVLVISDLAGKIVKRYSQLIGEKTIIRTEEMESGIYLLSLKSITNGTKYNGKYRVAK